MQGHIEILSHSLQWYTKQDKKIFIDQLIFDDWVSFFLAKKYYPLFNIS